MSRSLRDAQVVLEERARLLARPESVERNDTAAYVSFTIGAHALAVPLERVVRAAELTHLTELPECPRWLAGLSAIEGHLVTLLDLALFLDLGRHGVVDAHGVLVVAGDKREIGLVAEELLGICDLPLAAVATLPGARGPLMTMAAGLGPAGVDLFLLDVDRLFDDPRLNRRA